MSSHSIAPDLSCDVLVIGSGAGALAAAVSARSYGLDVIVTEKLDHFGGTSARSGGWIWIPQTSNAARAGVQDSTDAATKYLESIAGQSPDIAAIKVFLEEGPRMVDFFQAKTDVHFDVDVTFPDYHRSAGHSLGGRSLHISACNAGAIAGEIGLLQPPLKELVFFGMALTRSDLRRFFNVFRSADATAYVARRLGLHAVDLIRHGRSVHVVNGSALCLRLYTTCRKAGIPIWLSAPAQELLMAGGRVVGARVLRNGRPTNVIASRGVILATGGIGNNAALRRQYYPPAVAEGSSLIAAGSAGDGISMAAEVGAAVLPAVPNAGYWMVASRLTRPSGEEGIFPHSNGLDRSKPGFIIVSANGRRFVNECINYHALASLLIKNAEFNPAFVIGDRRAVAKYGIGAVRPFPMPHRHHLRTGYLMRGNSVRDLAIRAGIQPDVLASTIETFNFHARQGNDPEFGRGQSDYDRYQGDANHKPSPVLGALDKGPFYAVRLGVSDLASFAGIRTDPQARVLDSAGSPVQGLYAVGSDMANILGGGPPPGAGICLGLAMTFGYIAGSHLGRRN